MPRSLRDMIAEKASGSQQKLSVRQAFDGFMVVITLRFYRSHHAPRDAPHAEREVYDREVYHRDDDYDGPPAYA